MFYSVKIKKYIKKCAFGFFKTKTRFGDRTQTFTNITMMTLSDDIEL
jgi:hypothetical protein